MKGIILAGGLGSRLHPLTQITNKNLLPVYDKPMILYAIETLRASGIEDVLIVCGTERSEEFIAFLAGGEQYGVRLSFAFQEGFGGIGAALLCAEEFARGEKVAVIFGDNFFEDTFAASVERFKGGAMIFVKQVSDPHRFGVVKVEGDKIKSIEEKPASPKSDLAIVGFYLCDEMLFDKLKTLKPSARGELEITDVINQYFAAGKLSWNLITGFWSDMGTFDSLHETAAWIKERSRIKEQKKVKQKAREMGQ